MGAADTAFAILTRAPSQGGKSRLFAGLDLSPDRALLEALLLDTLERTAPAQVRQVVFVTPASGCDEVRALAPGLDVRPQAEGDLGARMRAAMDALLAGARHAALIGSDLPHLPASHVEGAFATLADDPEALVIGPALDGGYYLIGANRLPQTLFEGIEWGSGAVFDETVRRAGRENFRVRLLPPLADVDTPADLADVVRRHGPPRTRAWVAARAPHLLARPMS